MNNIKDIDQLNNLKKHVNRFMNIKDIDQLNNLKNVNRFMNNIKDIYKFFPHPTIRKDQKVIIPMIHDFTHSDIYNGMILCAGPGLGKEPCMTCQALLALEDGLCNKVIFTIPTDAGKENKLKELEGVKHKRRVMKVFSKEVLCNWRKEKADKRILALEPEESAYSLCKIHGHKCKYKENDCNYFLQKKQIKNVDILVCDFNYIVAPYIRRASGFEDILWENHVLLFIDECHLLKQRAEIILTNSISSTTMNRAIKELERYGYREEKEFIQNVLASIKEEVSINYKKLIVDMDKNYEGFGEAILQASSLERIFTSEGMGDRLIEVGESVSELKFEQLEGITSYSDILGNFILRFYKIMRENRENSNVFFLKLKEDMETTYIGWTPLDVRGFLRDAIKRSSKYILYSGTCKPLRIKNDVGLAFEKVYTPAPIESPYLVNRLDILLAKERFCEKNLNDSAFLERIKADLERLFPLMPKPIGILCTNQVYKSLKLDSIYPILNEPKEQEDVDYWLNNLVPKADFIRYGPYGRLGQSVDISCMKSIMVLGLPYQKYGAITQEKINKLAKSLKGKSGNTRAKAMNMQMVEPAYDRVLQSIMRGLRNETDRLVVIYYDVNFKLNKPALGSKNLILCNTIDEVISYLQPSEKSEKSEK